MKTKRSQSQKRLRPALSYTGRSPGGVKAGNGLVAGPSQNDPQVVLDVAATLATGRVSLSRGALIIAAARCVETGELDLGSALALVGAS